MKQDALIGVITLFDPVQKVGVITRKPGMAKSQSDQPDDVFFEVEDKDVLRLKQGQLVQFLMSKKEDTWLVKNIEVLSELS